jgi:hypothetical protein
VSGLPEKGAVFFRHIKKTASKNGGPLQLNICFKGRAAEMKHISFEMARIKYRRA